jgi:hypothetical protein
MMRSVFFEIPAASAELKDKKKRGEVGQYFGG